MEDPTDPAVVTKLERKKANIEAEIFEHLQDSQHHLLEDPHAAEALLHSLEENLGGEGEENDDELEYVDDEVDETMEDLERVVNKLVTGEAIIPGKGKETCKEDDDGDITSKEKDAPPHLPLLGKDSGFLKPPAKTKSNNSAPQAGTSTQKLPPRQAPTGHKVTKPVTTKPTTTPARVSSPSVKPGGKPVLNRIARNQAVLNSTLTRGPPGLASSNISKPPTLPSSDSISDHQLGDIENRLLDLSESYKVNNSFVEALAKDVANLHARYNTLSSELTNTNTLLLRLERKLNGLNVEPDAGNVEGTDQSASIALGSINADSFRSAAAVAVAKKAEPVGTSSSVPQSSSAQVASKYRVRRR